MTKGKAVQLVLNEEERGHGTIIEELIVEAEHMICMVAFAKKSAYTLIKDVLNRALKKGLNAKMAIGLDFHITEPAVLTQLLALTKKHAFKLYVSNSSSAFHPKIYAFQRGEKYSVVVGSANLTRGGFYGNYEASTLIDDLGGEMTKSIAKHFDLLVKTEELIPATKRLIDVYAAEFVIHEGYRRVAQKRAKNAIRTEAEDLALLRNILELMRSDHTEWGFEAQKVEREQNRKDARRMLKDPSQFRGLRSEAFLARYEALIGLFHSGGLHRHKTRLTSSAEFFAAAIDDITSQPDLSPEEAFEVLHRHFSSITGAGINLITEILHALEHKRFPVMNQNAVYGLAMAGIREYPPQPFKTNVDGPTYTRYCEHADQVRKALGLSDFTELDALFNYVYWSDLPGTEPNRPF
ncbi:HKD family nuclease [Pseudomonas sp. ADAK2 TE3594]